MAWGICWESRESLCLKAWVKGPSPHAALQCFERHRSITHSRSQIPGQDIYDTRLTRGHITSQELDFAI
ncbi:hypothetical protein VNO77_39072 [Canavalia gladiata]|uniref:Uncharacterized protein n=1 Tax=Canavalia gladiata TaxID=3824 RepID=A0AAN9K9S6_CANGL